MRGRGYDERFGGKHAMTFPEILEECGLKITRQEFYFRRPMHADGNEFAATAYETSVELRTGGDVYWLKKR